MALRRATRVPRTTTRLPLRALPRRGLFGTQQPSTRFRAHSDLCVATLQCNSQAPNKLENLKNIQALLRVRAKESTRSPDLILLPELFSSNYDLDFSTAWYSAEPMVEDRSPTLRYMRSWALEHKCFIAGTMMEATSDGDVYNSFVLYGPDGNRINKVLRKTRPASIEAFTFRGPDKMDDHVIELDLSLLPSFASEKAKYLRPLRVGVAICTPLSERRSGC